MAVALAAAHKVAARSLRNNEVARKQNIKSGSIKDEHEEKSVKDVETSSNHIPNQTDQITQSTPSTSKPDGQKRSTRSSTSAATVVDSTVESSEPEVKKELSASISSEQKIEDQQQTKLPQSSTPPRRRESTRARKPSSRLLPSPSPPPQRSSGTKKTLIPSTNTQSSDRITALASGLPAVGDSSTDSVMSELASGPGKRKRRPSTMTRPPSTITKGEDVEEDENTLHVSKSKGRTSTKSTSPEEKDVERISSASQKPKPIQKKTKGETSHIHKIKLSRPSTSLVSESDSMEASQSLPADTTTQDDAYDSDGGFQSIPIASNSNMARKSISKAPAEMTVDLMRSYSAASAAGSEPPPLISRRGGLKGSITLHRQSSKPSSYGHHQTQPNSHKWSWDRTGVNVPYLRFKLDNLPSKIEDEESSAAEEEDDFHVAMLNNDNFDAMSDAEEDEPRATTASTKSSPRAFKSHESSDIDDTPATTPQSPRSTCDGHERRNSQDRTIARNSQEVEEPKGRSRTVTRDAVFAHALEPSANRPHTHAGALTLSLPYDEMTNPNDDDTSAKGTLLVAENVIKTEEVDTHPSHDEADVGGVASELLGPTGSLDVQRQMLSSPNPSSAFVSPLMSNVQLVKGEPTPLALPPSYADGARNEKSKLSKSTRFDSASSSDIEEDDEEGENGFSQIPMAFGPPESVCLSELDRAWEQGEYLLRARKLANNSIEIADEDSPNVVRDKSSGKRPSDMQEVEIEDEGQRKKTRTPVKQTKSVPKASPTTTTRSTRRNTRRSSGTRS